MLTLLRRVVAAEEGQDVVEYALLAALVALASVVAVRAIQTTMLTTYVSWNTATQSCWQMPAPGTGGGC